MNKLENVFDRKGWMYERLQAGGIQIQKPQSALYGCIMESKTEWGNLGMQECLEYLSSERGQRTQRHTASLGNQGVPLVTLWKVLGRLQHEG